MKGALTEVQEAVVEVEVEGEVVVTLKKRVKAVMVYTCWAAVVRSSPSMETDVPIPASVPLCDGNDYTAAPQQGSAGLNRSVSARPHHHSPVPRSLVVPHHWSGVQCHSPSAVVVCTGPSTIVG